MHPDYMLDTLMSRTMNLLMDKLRLTPSKAAKHLNFLEAKRHRLDRKCPARSTGVHEYRKELFSRAAKKYAADNTTKQNTIRKTIVSKSSKVYKVKQSNFKQVYTRRAIVMASIQHESHMAKRAALSAEIIIAREKVALETSTSIHRQLSLREAHLTDDMLNDMDALWSDPDYNGPRVQSIREKHMKAPSIMSDCLALALFDHEVPDENAPKPA